MNQRILRSMIATHLFDDPRQDRHTRHRAR